MDSGKPKCPWAYDPNRNETYGGADQYWTEPPPEPSARLLYWQERVKQGWRPNKRIRRMGYYMASHWYGVYIWEYIHVMIPLLYPPQE